MPEFAALIESVNQNITRLSEELEDTQNGLDSINAKMDRLPEVFIPRTEAEVKAQRIKKALAVIVFAGVLVTGGGVWMKTEFVAACQDSRESLRQVINTAVADRQPLSTSTPETIAAIEQQNINQIRPLREKLLALDGTQPSKC